MEFLPFTHETPLTWWQQWKKNCKFWVELGQDRVFYYVPVVWLNTQHEKLFGWLQLCAICECRFTWPPERCVCKHCLKGEEFAGHYHRHRP